jgi:hypothetical protein
LYIPKNFDNLLKSFGNEELYKKQRSYLRKTYYQKEVKEAIELIKKYKKVLEQEVI